MYLLKKIGFFFILLFLFTCAREPDTLFHLVPAEQTGIAFNNTIVESDSLNMLDYEYTYSGGGIAVADFNNDGLQDLYFVGNTVSNRLYLNEGSLKFRDITKVSNAGSSGLWHTGVSAVDINNDGWMDLYLSVARSEDPEKRKNVLLIHQGLNEEDIPTFKNKAAEYGLASTSFSTKSAFFDYDNDGDLDMYEMVADKRRKSRQDVRLSDAERLQANTDNLFQNDWDSTRGHPYFTEVSEEAGITKAGYGLGLNITDINNDGWQDIYVGNDFISNDLLWINNGDGTFTDRAGSYFKHTSFSAMGTDIADINNDGLMDVIALDMAGSNNIQKQTMFSPNNYQNYFNNVFRDFDPQYTRNTLQLNQGVVPGMGENSHPVFSEIAYLSGVAETDWSWGVLMADFNNDSYNDMVITNGIPRNKIDKDFVRFRNQMSSIASKSMLLDSIPRDKSENFVFKNNGNLTFDDVSKDWGLGARAYSTGVVWADLDDDGDLDIVMNNINDQAFIYENSIDEQVEDHSWVKVRFEGTEKNKKGIGARVSVFEKSGQQTKINQPFRGYLSTVENIVHFGLDESMEIDSVVVHWPQEAKQVWTNVQPNQTLVAKYAESELEREAGKENNKYMSATIFEEVTEETGINYIHREQDYTDFKIQRMLPYKLSQYGPSLAVGDINEDGLEDLFIGGSLSQQGTILLQKKDGTFSEQTFNPDTGNGDEPRREDAGTLLFDADGDGDQDLYIVSGSVESVPQSSAYQDRFYENEGDGNFVLRPEALPEFKVSGSAIRAADFDKDGDLDLFIGGRVLPRFYPVPVSSFILRNDTENGKIKFTNVSNSVAPALEELGRVTDALWTDFNNDGWQDLIIAGEWMPLTFLENHEGKLEDVTDQTGIQDKTGWWNSLAAGDFDSDGDIDYIAGNLGLNSIYKAKENEPVKIYGDDFDGNDAYDMILTYYNSDSIGQRKEFPAHRFEDFHWQLPRRAQRISTIKEYANATITDLFTPEELEEARTYQATELRTSYVENKGEGKFNMSPLPKEAQFAPVFGMVTEDVTKDGKLDVLLTGNLFGAEVQVGSYDAFNGLLLKGDGEGGFTPVSMEKSGIYIPDDGKSLVKMYSQENGYQLVASQNQEKLKVFEYQDAPTILTAEPMDAYALLVDGKGNQQKYEFYYGSSFQSSSGRFLIIPENIKEVTIVDYKGNQRKINF